MNMSEQFEKLLAEAKAQKKWKPDMIEAYLVLAYAHGQKDQLAEDKECIDGTFNRLMA